MASYYLKWGEERLEEANQLAAEEQALAVQKDMLGDEGIDALANKTESFKAMNPFETDDLAIASATMNLTTQQYHQLYMQTKPIESVSYTHLTLPTKRIV